MIVLEIISTSAMEKNCNLTQNHIECIFKFYKKTVITALLVSSSSLCLRSGGALL